MKPSDDTLEIPLISSAAIIAVLAVLAVLVLASTTRRAVDVPIVQMSTSQNKCVQVIDKGVKYPCPENFDKATRYSVEWVR